MPRPNLLVIMSDQHNPHIMGCTGDPLVRTPNLDRMATSGILFERNYCAGPLCVPSRMSFMAGQHPNDLRIWTNGGLLPSDTPTFAHALSLAGYDTMLCGRMHFVGPDQMHGFRRRLVGDVSGAMTGSGREMFENVWNRAGCGQGYASLLPDAVGPGWATYPEFDRHVTDRACDVLRQQGEGNGDTPFAMVVGYLLPHNPYVCPRELFEEYMDQLEGQTIQQEQARDEHPALASLRRTRGTANITPEMARRSKAAYLGLTTILDQNIGQILDALEENGLAENTIIAYTSDHGDQAGEHGLWWKDTFYDGSVKVPMIWSCPSQLAAGVRVPQVTSLLDIAPTLTDFADAPPLPSARGSSLRSFLESGVAPPDWPDTAFAETYAREQRPARMICSGDWKLNVYHGYEHPQFFNLRDDPGEDVDLGQNADYAAIREELLAKVTHDWSGERVERTEQAIREERQLMGQWNNAVAPEENERWPMPPGCNYRD
ncbi:MAG: sulfatase-like hydrolase/transferase [Lentisphaerae bacterium]|jgi:choline-sulfatase|nr:sulfatase-like hydrolase/transferase [Lentisphaerota bacterium]MBT4817595.1 sulfatase-like hydrolase/transferase [Lentisphaerota bacterium]MBT5607469.1 sulfatase-like hydrolase/transferase [Lentisphaerota bacterium]MBT7055749.1 sulfatase-like hydrolase/transferase [Lentisphaerota bacterium]MBT7843116.1 sulfatase-like hydrolase/transferase [Lentisphaerota bacterium]